MRERSESAGLADLHKNDNQLECESFVSEVSNDSTEWLER